MSEPYPTLRRDAARNRRRILTVAAEVFASRGLETTMEDVAGAVGVGVGTLYRHFGSKAALIEALFEDGVEAQLQVMLELGRAPRAWDGLCAVMRHLVETQLQEPGTIQVLYAGVDSAPEVLRTRVEPFLTDLVTRAKAEGLLRADFAATDVPIVAFALSRLGAMPTHGAPLARRYLEIFLKGMAPTPDDAEIPEPLADDDFGLWFRAVGGRGA
ncbi:TetR/AcrR family transcriptional regulator [Microbacterium sp. GXF7504]